MPIARARAERPQQLRWRASILDLLAAVLFGFLSSEPVGNDVIELGLGEPIAFAEYAGDAHDGEPVVPEHGVGLCPCALDNCAGGRVQRLTVLRPGSDGRSASRRASIPAKLVTLIEIAVAAAAAAVASEAEKSSFAET